MADYNSLIISYIKERAEEIECKPETVQKRFLSVTGDWKMNSDAILAEIENKTALGIRLYNAAASTYFMDSK